MRTSSLSTRFALAAGILSTLVVILFASLSAWRFYTERLDVLSGIQRHHQFAQAQHEIAWDEFLELIGVYLVSVPVFAAISAACAWWIGQRLARPFVSFTQAVGRIDAQTLNERVAEATGSAEISRLSKIFNQMLDRLETSFNQARRFSADASHELRTPLTIMRARMELAINKDPHSAQSEDLAALLEDNQRLIKITESLLALARADAGKLVVDPGEVDLSLLLESIVDDFSIIGRQRKINFEGAISHVVAVRGDLSLLRQLFLNLFENALRYNREGGRVHYLLVQSGAEAVFTIANTGHIIPEQLQHRLFERFFRSANSRDRESGGSGLGLSLALEITRAHGGELKLVSSNSEGTTFQVSLPIFGPS